MSFLNVLFESIKTSKESVSPTLRSKLGRIDSIPSLKCLQLRIVREKRRETLTSKEVQSEIHPKIHSLPNTSRNPNPLPRHGTRPRRIYTH